MKNDFGCQFCSEGIGRECAQNPNAAQSSTENEIKCGVENVRVALLNR